VDGCCLVFFCWRCWPADAKVRESGTENEISFLTEKFGDLHKKAITAMSLYTDFQEKSLKFKGVSRRIVLD
jgi:hypothetical protein